MSAENRGSTYSNRNEIEERSVVIYDHLGNLVTKNRPQDLVPEENVKREVININTGYHRIINKIHKNKDTVIWRSSTTEMENHADTHCFGANF